MEKVVFVYVELEGKLHFVGKLWSHYARARESASFQYDKTWLESHNRFSLEPALMLDLGSYHTGSDKSLFGSIGDSAPDRWGRLLMLRAERNLAKKEGRTPHTLREIDYLLMVNDEVREGALRFSLRENGPFLADKNHKKIPPLVDLPKLLSATDRFLNDNETDEDLKLLLAPGSSLGGARPKASIRDKNGHLAIAKFPSKSDQLDDYNIVLWEAIALQLARKASILTTEFRIEKVNNHPVLIVSRFDRLNGDRIPYLSAMSMLGAKDNEQHSYLEIADALRQYGSNPTGDLHELWKRMLFNVMISNTDDHLRNHGFLYVGQEGWRLSPAFDLNPVPIDIKPKNLSTAITIDDTTASIELVMSVASYFNLEHKVANRILNEVSKAISGWREEARKHGISNIEIERMETCFPPNLLK